MKIPLALLLFAVLHQGLADTHCIRRCNNQLDGIYGWCGTCKMFLSCTDGKASVMYCNDGTVFDILNETCSDDKNDCHLDDETWSPCRAELCDHGICVSDGDTYTCDCDPGYKGKHCDCPIKPCDRRPTPCLLDSGKDKVAFFPAHGFCYNTLPITKTLCTGDCPEGERCTGMGNRRTLYDLYCDDGFKFSTYLYTDRYCDCRPISSRECAPQPVVRHRRYFNCFAGGFDYQSNGPVTQMVCGGGCRDNEKETCVRLNNYFEYLPIVLTDPKSGNTVTYMMENDVECHCMQY